MDRWTQAVGALILGFAPACSLIQLREVAFVIIKKTKNSFEYFADIWIACPGERLVHGD